MTTLKANSIGLIGATLFGIVMLSPAMTIYGNFGPSFLAVGRSTPLAFLFALAATIPTAVSYALLSRDFPSAGSASSWIAEARAGRIANWAGWIIFLYYFTNFIIQPVTLGVFLGDLAPLCGLKSGLWTYILGATLCCAGPAWVTYRGIIPSERGVMGFLVFETAIVIALCLTVYFLAPSRGAHFSLEGFRLTSIQGGASGFFRAVIFGILTFCGFDVISTLSEESRLPRKLIPEATFICLITFGLFIVAAMWVMTFAADQAQLRQVAEGGAMPISEVARMYWGRGAVLVPLTAISASLGLSVATSIGASRILLSIGRREHHFKWLAVLHPRYQVPWNAMHLIFIVGFISAVLTGVTLGAYGAFVWWGTTSVFFAMITYLMANAANLILFKSRIRRSMKEFILHAVVPVVGICLDGYILIRSFFIELWNQGWANGQSVILFDVACAVLALVVVFRLSAAKD